MEDEVDWGVEEEDFDPWATQSNGVTGSSSSKKDKSKEKDVAKVEVESGTVDVVEDSQGAGNYQQDLFGAGPNAHEETRTPISIPLPATPSTFTPGPPVSAALTTPALASEEPPSTTGDIMPIQLPPGWVRKESRNKAGKHFYYNTTSKEVRWDLPPMPPATEEEIEEPSTPPLSPSQIGEMEVATADVVTLDGPSNTSSSKETGQLTALEPERGQDSSAAPESSALPDNVPKGPKNEQYSRNANEYQRNRGRKGDSLRIKPRDSAEPVEAQEKVETDVGRARSAGNKRDNYRSGDHRKDDIKLTESRRDDRGSFRRDPMVTDSYVPSRQFDADRGDRGRSGRDSAFASQPTFSAGDRGKDAAPATARTPVERSATDVRDQQTEARGPPSGAWGRDSRNKGPQEHALYPSRERGDVEKPLATLRSSTGSDRWEQEKKKSSDAMEVDRPYARNERDQNQAPNGYERKSSRFDRSQQQDKGDLRRPREEEGPRYGEAPSKRAREGEARYTQPVFKRRDEDSPVNRPRGDSDLRGNGRSPRDDQKETSTDARSGTAHEALQRPYANRDQARFPERAADVRSASTPSQPPQEPAGYGRGGYRVPSSGAEQRPAQTAAQGNYAPILNNKWGKPAESTSGSIATPRTPYGFADSPSKPSGGDNQGRATLSDAFPDAGKPVQAIDRDYQSAKNKKYNFAPMANDERMREPASPVEAPPVTGSMYPSRAREQNDDRRVRPAAASHPDIPSGPRGSQQGYLERKPSHRVEPEQPNNRGYDQRASMPSPQSNGGNDRLLPQSRIRTRSPEPVREPVVQAPVVAPKPGPYVNPARAAQIQHLTPAFQANTFAKPAVPTPTREFNAPSGPRYASGSDGPRAPASDDRRSGYDQAPHRNSADQVGVYRGSRDGGASGSVDSGWKPRSNTGGESSGQTGYGSRSADGHRDGSMTGRDAGDSLLNRIGERDNSGGRDLNAVETRRGGDDRRSGAPPGGRFAPRA